MSEGELVLYATEDGAAEIQLRAIEGAVWLSQVEMAELFQTTKQNVSLHVRNILAEGELTPEATVKEYLTVQTEGARQVKRTVTLYRLEMILAVGYRVRSPRGTQFRRWATSALKDYLVIGRYKRLPPRAFAYNPMRINVGSIAMNDGAEEVLVSPDYVVFGCNPDGIDPDYLDHLRKTRWWGHYINSGGSGSVRMRTYYDDLAAMKLPLPEMDEQQEILRVLNVARDEVTKTAQQIDVLTRQKRGLMQKLLTGEWRVSP